MVQAFDRVNHSLLVDEIARVVKDTKPIDLIYKLLRVGYVNVANSDDYTWEGNTGTPQGSGLRPLFANIV